MTLTIQLEDGRIVKIKFSCGVSITPAGRKDRWSWHYMYQEIKLLVSDPKALHHIIVKVYSTLN